MLIITAYGEAFMRNRSVDSEKNNRTADSSAKHVLLKLMLIFLKIGAFTFGGGYAMIALLEEEFVSKQKWLTSDEFADMTAIAESTPGPIAINCATYIGYRQAGIPGAVLSTLSVSFPAFLIIYVISLFFDRFLGLKWVGYAFSGIKVCVILLIFNAGWKMFKKMKKSIFSVIVFSATLTAMLLFYLFGISFSSVFLILISGFSGLSVYLINKIAKCRKEGDENHA